MPKLEDQAIALGAARTATVLPQLAIHAAEAARRGDVDESSANELFERYYTVGGKLKVDTNTSSWRVQCSKLRQIIKAKDPVLLREVTEAYDKLGPGERKGSLYDAMVAACRYLIVRGSRPGTRKLRELIAKR